MINDKDILNIDYFNLDLIKEALRQAELKMQDENSRKIRIDQRAYILIPFIISSIAYIILKITDLPFDVIYKQSIMNGIYLYFVLLVSSGIGVFLALKPRPYASIGRTPDIWLKKEVIASENNRAFGMILTKILLDYYFSIEQTDKINNIRIKWIRKSSLLFLSAWGILLFCIFINYPF